MSSEPSDSNDGGDNDDVSCSDSHDSEVYVDHFEERNLDKVNNHIWKIKQGEAMKIRSTKALRKVAIKLYQNRSAAQ